MKASGLGMGPVLACSQIQNGSSNCQKWHLEKLHEPCMNLAAAAQNDQNASQRASTAYYSVDTAAVWEGLSQGSEIIETCVLRPVAVPAPVEKEPSDEEMF